MSSPSSSDVSRSYGECPPAMNRAASVKTS